MYRCPVYEAPYIWDSRFIQHHVDVIKNKTPDRSVEYFPKSDKKRISTVEPNINMVKTSVVPIIIS